MDAQSGNLGTVADQNDQVSIGNRQDLQGNEEVVKEAVLIDFTNSADSANDESAEEAVIIDFTNSTDSAENNEEGGLFIS